MSKIYDKIATTLFWLSGGVILIIISWFLYTIFNQGLPIISYHFLTSPPSEIEAGGGIAPEIFNTFYTLILTLIFSLPIGIGAGIYLSEFAKDNIFTKFIRLCIECLASVPSIVFGLFGMIIFIVKFRWGFSIIGGSVTLALLNLPVIVRVTEESLKAIPFSYKESSFALGATHWQTIRKVLLPSAAPSLITGINLVSGRIVGESAVLIYTAGTSVSKRLIEFNPFSAGETLSVHLWYVKSVAIVPDASKIAAGTAVILILIILSFNILMNIISRYIKHKFQAQ